MRNPIERYDLSAKKTVKYKAPVFQQVLFSS